MIEKEFHKKLREKYNPDGSELRELQLKLIELLKRFDAICKDNDIEYWLSSGTCLGAIRHKGFIPWDDDIDVEMLRDDYMKFVKLFKEDEHFVLQTYHNDLYYTQPFGKLRSKDILVVEGNGLADQNYKYKGIFLDIFVMERSPRIIAMLSHLLVGSMRYFGFLIKRRNCFIDGVFWILKQVIYGVISFLRLFCFLGKANILRHTLGTGVEKNIRKVDEIFPLENAPFEGMVVPVPGNYDKYLKRMYGDYMKIPQEIHTHKLSIKKRL